jgi:hypothetical protein
MLMLLRDPNEDTMIMARGTDNHGQDPRATEPATDAGTSRRIRTSGPIRLAFLNNPALRGRPESA